MDACLPLPTLPPAGNLERMQSGTPTRTPKEPVVYDYLDVRGYLGDLYRFRKARGRGWSFRAFSRKAGLASPNHLKRVIDGERELTAEMAARYAQALGLDAAASTYFCDLAAFARATTAADRNAAYQRLSTSRGYRRAQRIEIAHAAYHGHWWIPAIRELALRPDFRNEPAWIAAQLLPPIRPAEAAEAMEVLISLDMLAVDADGRPRQGNAVVTTGPETRGLHIGNYHRTMMQRAAAAIDLVPARDRDISSLTFCVGPGRLAQIKERIREFRKELIALAADEPAGDQVIQLNFQLFPLSVPGPGPKETS